MTHQVQVRYSAAARELAGCELETVVLPAAEIGGSELLVLLGALHPRLAPFLPRLKLAINDELRHGEPRVRAGDLVDVMPPVAGGSSTGEELPVVLTALRDTPLSIDDVYDAVSHPAAGGIAIFVGVVRNHAEGQAVDRLDYEAHATLAARELARIATEVQAEHPGSRVCAIHRTGSLRVGDKAVVVAASSAHRADAFAACRALIERIKESVPIWKKEWALEGDASWVNLK